MELYLFRHGIAEDGEPGSPDSSRELTDEGRRKAADVMKLARKTGVRPSLILTSPYIRARQTARIAAEELEFDGQVMPLDSLVPHSSPENVWTDIRDYADHDALLLAGHEPLLSRLVAHLLNAPSLRVEMKKAALVRIDIETMRGQPHGILRWMIVPKMT
ncbi:MAG TPA: phosphohistidine phosphatase SixA [Bryobacteraceae bacterium]|nr:phosphohistidine phosphatase SixA [Bryobacteraceae bacterium]